MRASTSRGFEHPEKIWSVLHDVDKFGWDGNNKRHRGLPWKERKPETSRIMGSLKLQNFVIMREKFQFPWTEQQKAYEGGNMETVVCVGRSACFDLGTPVRARQGLGSGLHLK